MAPVTRQQDQKPDAAADEVKITLYWLEKSRAHRILWLLEELSIPYELKTFKRKNMLAPPEFKEIHPLGKAPLITVSSPATGDKPIVIAESGPIVEYLLEHFGKSFLPKQWKEGKEGQVGGETEGWLRYRYFMHYVEGSLMPYMVMALIFRILREQSPFFIRPLTAMLTGTVESKYLQPNMANNLRFLESQLETSPDGGEYLCGPDITGADFLISYPVQAARERAGLTKEAYPRLWAYVERLEEREGYKKSVKKIVEVDALSSPDGIAKVSLHNGGTDFCSSLATFFGGEAETDWKSIL
ncbi:uncharacterized protein KY384_006623 [Bacidia gigantensis]|uniref:uncharacterized protein n=1 Tax=Bacidia gigantensis TaxID=2732470 RepID=UPI001D05903F|nr:uncharacterized protein KY384_006623 [Bacidia gigantensis]KAG8528934.1 hypothetical protein KY384_006623 [Bacidia gigantensis]